MSLVLNGFWTETGTSIQDGIFSSRLDVQQYTHFWARFNYNLVGVTAYNFLLWASVDGAPPGTSPTTAPVFRTTNNGLNQHVLVGPLNSAAFAPMMTSFGWGSGPVAGPAPQSGEVPYGVDITAWPIPCPIKGFHSLYFQVQVEGASTVTDFFELSPILIEYP